MVLEVTLVVVADEQLLSHPLVALTQIYSGSIGQRDQFLTHPEAEPDVCRVGDGLLLDRGVHDQVLCVFMARSTGGKARLDGRGQKFRQPLVSQTLAPSPQLVGSKGHFHWIYSMPQKYCQ